MTIERWSPFADIRRLDDVFSKFWRGNLAESQEAWSIPLDVTRNQDDVVVKASLPGLDKDKLDVTIEENVLTIRAELSEEGEREDSGYLLRERRTGSFFRAIRLPETVDSEKVSSVYKDGVLTVNLPKLEEKKAKKITIATE
jgi:HSP20 family protein